MSNQLIQNLLTPSAYDHPVQELKLLETHISWIILTGRIVYKIKKPVDFEFLNYSTLEKRKFYCEEEIRLNRALAPELYLEVVTINGTIEQPHINGTGPILDYAVKMHEFSQEKLFTHLLQQEQLTTELIDQLAQQVAQFHQQTPVADAHSILGTPEHVHAPVVQNFDQIRPLLTGEKDREQLKRLEDWSNEQYKQHYALLQKRKTQGFIRECHGDLHLGNIILHHNKPLLFDRIEFNDDFLWTDVLADIAFLAMDLDDHGQFKLAQRLLNQYFQVTGDYEGLALLPYYQAYRAIVRAKVALFRLAHGQLDASEQEAILKKYRNLMNLAEKYTEHTPPKLYIMHGYSGVGKSIAANLLAEKLSAFSLRSDLERKRLAGVNANAKTNSALNAGIYDATLTDKTYAQLLQQAKIILTSGYTAIVDATFLKESQRKIFHDLAKELNVSFKIIACHAPRAQLEQWIKQREMQNHDPSEANLNVLAMQEQSAEALTEDEKQLAVMVDTVKMNVTEIIN